MSRPLRPTPRAGRAVLAALAAIVALAALTACTGVPTSGPVRDAGPRTTVDEDPVSDVSAVPPRPGLTPSAVVLGFIDAMAASPTRIDIAQQYLTGDAAAAWEPEAGTITFGARQQPRDQRLEISVDLVDAERFDRSGTYLGRIAPSRSTLRFDLQVEGGEFRITNPPDALVVSRGWFNQRYRQASLYYFDPTGRIVVPEPVFVPRGDELASNLVARLLAGPGPRLGRFVRSYLPRGLDAGLSVPVSLDGVARVDLGGGPGVTSSVGAERLLAQLAWTLRQEPRIRALQVTLGGEPVRGPEGQELYDVDEADLFGPTGPDPSTDLYAVRDQALQVRDGNELVPVPGPLGGERPVRSAVPDIPGVRAAGVTPDGGTLVLADLVEAGAGEPPTPTQVVLRGADDLQPPAWDFAGRLWVVDRNGGDAVVHVVVDGRDRVVPVPGVSGRDVRSLLVSRDGTRVVAVVRGETTDELRVGRVELDDEGLVDSVPITTPIDVQPDLAVRVDDITWTSPTTIAELTTLEADAIYEVRSVGVDGSPDSTELQPVPVGGPVTALAGTPVEDQPTYAVTPTSFIDITDDTSFGFVGDPPTSVLYAG
ncbi:LpqB family beta-propeller domain-containing protein [Nocardioides litoris]|uniref:LpqB family beta-propeller domain-containing protein n=1 Tax=Nocardioides litoris TaxID=1926648 RepID=UPI0011230946|nr:LpqB family beta-propeller domain-containing protein [Nocardioides litoris]